MTSNEKLNLAIEALRIIALSYRQKIDRADTPPYEFARACLERLDEDLDTIPDKVGTIFKQQFSEGLVIFRQVWPGEDKGALKWNT